MQASTALSNDKPLPRAIQRQMAALADRTPKAEPESSPPAPEPQPQAAAQPAPTVAPSIAPTAAPTSQPSKPEDPDYWERRCKASEGRLRAEREERQTGEVALHQRITELQQQIATLQAGAPAPQADPRSLLTAEQIETLGDEESQAVAQAAAKAAEQAAQRVLDERLKPLEERAAQDQAQAARSQKQAFLDRLTEMVPEWEAMDADQAWLDWLAQDDQATGLPRQQILNTHVGRYDAAKAAKMFQSFKDLHTPPMPPVAPHGSGAVAAGEIPQPDGAATRPLTAAEITAFYKRAALGKVSNEERVVFEKRMKLPRR